MSIVAKKIMMGSGAVDLPSDDEFNRTSFLSHFDGANNGVNNVFDDASASNHTMTASGNVTQGSFSPFARPDGEFGVDTSGGWTYWGYNVAGTGALGDEDFCMESFVFINTFAAKQGIASRNYSGTGISNETWRWEVQTNGTMTMISKNFFGQDAAGLTSSTALTLNTWHHIAAVRQNDTLTFYIDGVARGATSSGSGVFSTSDAMWNIGSNGYQTANSTSLQGTMSNFRLVVGSAVYTSNFTVPSSKLTAITNTEMLTYQSNHFVDNSADGNGLPMVSLPAVTAFGPFLTSEIYSAATNGGSLYNGVDVDANYVSAADSADWNLGSGNYTVECWAYATAQGSFNKLVGQWAYNGTNSANSWILETVGTDMEAYAIIGGSAVLIAQGAAFTINQWHHVALVRNGNNHNIYIDGVAGSTTSNSGTYVNGTGALEVGGFSQLGGGTWDGYITDVRVVKGTAVYTSNFTPPTAPLTAITNTKLLLNMADSQAIDSAAHSIITLSGNANVSTDQAKFGNTSLHTDGSGDAALVKFTNAGDLNFGTGDFTLECFVRFADTDNTQVLISNWESGGNTWYLAHYGGSNKLTFYPNAREFAWDPSANTWYHMALTRASGVLKAFVDGTQIGSNISETANLTGANNHMSIGGAGNAGESLNGFFDEVRVSKFARYTSNFTAPSEPFADKGQ